MLNILVVDDEPGIRMGVAYPLSDAGYRVTEAADGAEAIRRMAEQVFDVAIFDIRLPKVDGLTLFRRLHETSPRTAIILMTAYANISDAVAALREGAYDYVVKPFDTEQFTLGVIGRIAEKRALEEQLREARAMLASRASLSTGTAIGGRSPAMVAVDVRVVSASAQDLKEGGADGHFREDLYRRLSLVDLTVPPLRERQPDLPLLVEHFLAKFSPDPAVAPTLTPRAWAKITKYLFPGNVRELEHAIERAVVLAPRGAPVDLEHLPPEITGASTHATPLSDAAQFPPLEVALKEFEREHILQALNAAAGERPRAASLLGIPRKQLFEKLRAHGISYSYVDNPNGPVWPMGDPTDEEAEDDD